MTIQSEATLYLTHSPGMTIRARRLMEEARKFSDDFARFSDDLAGLLVVIESGAKIAQGVLDVGHAPADVELTRQQREDRNG